MKIYVKAVASKLSSLDISAYVGKNIWILVNSTHPIKLISSGKYSRQSGPGYIRLLAEGPNTYRCNFIGLFQSRNQYQLKYPYLIEDSLNLVHRIPKDHVEVYEPLETVSTQYILDMVANQTRTEENLIWRYM